MLLVVAFTGCKKDSSPTTPAQTPASNPPTSTSTVTPTGTPSLTSTATLTSTPSSTPTVTLTPTATPYIRWNVCSINREINDWGATPVTQVDYNLQITVNGVAETTCAVTVTGPGGAVRVPYVSSISDNANYYYSDTVSYTPGGTYVFEAYTSVGTASATFVAPGGDGFAPGGTSLTWAYPGNRQGVSVYDSSKTWIQNYTPTSLPYNGYMASCPSSGTYYFNLFAADIPTTNGVPVTDGNTYIADRHYTSVYVTVP